MSTVGPVPVEPGDRQPAPGDLRLLQNFVNTADRIIDLELLRTPADLEEWLRDRELLERRVRLDAADLERALRVREALRELLRAHTEFGAPAREDMTELERLSDAARLSVRFADGERWELVPQSGGLDAALGRLLAIAFVAKLDGTWERLKACHSDECRWAFYDRSKNRSGRWCTMKFCGARAKMRSYRERLRSAL